MLHHFKRHLIWTFLPALLWVLAIYSRPYFIHPHCADTPGSCTRESLLSLDQPALGLEALGADSLSFTTQGLSGVIAIGVPIAWQTAQWALGRATPVGALLSAGADLLILVRASVWNGLFTESAHLVSQRPRPFVYADPIRAHDFSNYTSFYSGHTSFSAASTLTATLTLVHRGAPAWLWLSLASVAYALISLTGLFRVLAGRHFPTDVLLGALAGMAVAIFVAATTRPSKKPTL